MPPLVTLFTLLFLTVSAVALPSPAAPQPVASSQAPAAQQPKQITDAAEYNAYVAALNEQNPARKVQLIDEFLAKYPNTVVKEDALVFKLTAQQQAGQAVDQTARQILQVNPNNLRALLVLSYVFLQTQLTEQDPQYQQKLSEAETLAKRGIEQLAAAPRPENVSEADYQKSKGLAEATFHQVIGLVGRHRKDFATAQAELKKAGELAPEDAAIFYRLGDAYIAEKPPKYTEAFWAFARAAALDGPTALPPAGRTQVNDYLTKVYTSYHGSDEGLDKLKEAAKASRFPTEGFRVIPKSELQPPTPPPAPTPAPGAGESMSFAQIKDTLSAGGEKAKELWGKLKGQTLGLEGKVVSAVPAARPRTVRLAVLPSTAETPGAYDVSLALAAPLARPLAAGKMVQFQGVANDFTPKPFALRMVGGQITRAAEAAPAPAKPAPRRPAARRRRG